MYPPSGVRCTLRAGCGVPSERSVIFALFGACYSPRSKRVARLARSVLLAPPEACCSPRPKRTTRHARSVLLASPEACCSPCPKRVTRSARSVLLALPGACCSPRPTFDLIFFNYCTFESILLCRLRLVCRKEG